MSRISINELSVYYSEYTLSEFLKTLSLKELKSAEMNMYLDDIVGDKINILDAIKNEIEYRESDKTLTCKKKCLISQYCE